VGFFTFRLFSFFPFPTPGTLHRLEDWPYGPGPRLGPLFSPLFLFEEPSPCTLSVQSAPSASYSCPRPVVVGVSRLSGHYHVFLPGDAQGVLVLATGIFFFLLHPAGLASVVGGTSRDLFPNFIFPPRRAFFPSPLYAGRSFRDSTNFPAPDKAHPPLGLTLASRPAIGAPSGDLPDRFSVFVVHGPSLFPAGRKTALPSFLPCLGVSLGWPFSSLSIPLICVFPG